MQRSALAGVFATLKVQLHAEDSRMNKLMIGWLLPVSARFSQSAVRRRKTPRPGRERVRMRE
jgi:hypothetical protein